jgi:hypothetical protein
VAEADPGSAGEAQPEPDRGAEQVASPVRATMARWLEHDEEHAGPASERGEPTEELDETGGSLEPDRQVDEQDVDGARLEERAGHREPLVRVCRGKHDEPLEPDPSGDRLDRVQASIEVEPGDDRAGCLRLGDEPEGDRRSSARGIAAQGETRRPRDTTRPEQRIELREASRDDGHTGYAGCAREWSPKRLARQCHRIWLGQARLGQVRLGRIGQCLDRRRLDGQHLGRERYRRERADDPAVRVTAPPRRGRAPALPEGRKGGADISGRCRHRTHRIEQMFYKNQPRSRSSARAPSCAQHSSSASEGSTRSAPRPPTTVTGSSWSGGRLPGYDDRHDDRAADSPTHPRRR